MLDEQSGTLLPGGNTQFPGRGTFPIETEQRAHYKDAGGASRFFPSFEGQEPPDAPFFYTGKASKRETTLDGQVENNHPCLHPDSLVMTPEGYRPISTLGVGSHVLAADGRFHSVEAVTQHPYTSEALVEIRIAGSNITSLVTDNHPYLVWRPERHKAAIVGGSVHWLRADEIRVGDYTMTPVVLGGVEGMLPPRAEDTEFWFLIGLYLAEGSKQKAGHGENVYPRFALHEDETDLVDRLRMYFAPSETTVSVYPNGGHGIAVMAFDPEFGALCEELCGCGAATKKLHPCVWNLPEESLCALVNGYFAGDGGRVRNYLQAKTSSPHVASQMRFLGEMLGYKVELQWCAPESGRIGDRAFQTVLPYYVIRMNERNRTIQGRKPSRPTVLEHEGITYLLSYVKRLDHVPYVGDVVNLSVEGSHTFQTAAGMSHNTKKPLALMEWLVKLVCPKKVLTCPICTGRIPTHEVSGMRQPVHTEAGGADRVLDSVPEQNLGPRRQGHPAQDMPDVQGAVHPEEQGGEVLLNTLPSQGSGASESRVPCLQGGLSPQGSDGQESEVLLPRMRSTSEASYSSDMPGMREALSTAGKEPQPVLLEEVLCGVHRESETKGRVPDDARLQGSLVAEPSDGYGQGIRAGAPSGDGPTLGEKSASHRGRSSSKRRQDGQPDRESGASVEGRARRAPEAPLQTFGVSSLPGSDSGERKCPRCGASMIWDAGIVLDPYCGSGTTCVAATFNDMHFIGIERDPVYHGIACKRVGIIHERQERERTAKSAHAFMEELEAELGGDEDIYGSLRR